MGINAQKKRIADALNQAAQARALDEIQRTGKALPCSVVAVNQTIMTVKFEVQSEFTLPNVTVPIYGSEYVRLPIQVGDKGVCFPADAYLGHINGLGSQSVSTRLKPMNLSALVFFPIGNKDFEVVDPNAVTLYGKNGAVIRDKAHNSIVTLLPSGITIQGKNYITLITGSATIQMSSSGNITVSGGTVNVHGSNVSVTGSSVSIASSGTLGMSDSMHAITLSGLVNYINNHTHPDPDGGSTGAPNGNI